VTLRCGEEHRTLPVEEFFIDYGKQDRRDGDFVESLHIPFLADQDRFAAYKISKRMDEDISAVAIAFRMRERSGVVEDIKIACGGLAATPKRAKNVERLIVGKTWTEEIVTKAVSGFDEDFTPLSDWRASAGYRSLVAKNLLRRFFLETTQSSENIRLVRETSAGVHA
ncbi:MAG: xanthine dehydrogenase small subunit, partial [Rhizobiaceae bacterium]